MILTYTTSQNQNWFDLAIQLLGSPESAYELARLNNSSLLVNPLPFTEIIYDSDVLPINNNGFNNSDNSIISTSPNIYILVNSFSNDFNLNEFF